MNKLKNQIHLCDIMLGLKGLEVLPVELYNLKAL
jgi:hypothetical protein